MMLATDNTGTEVETNSIYQMQDILKTTHIFVFTISFFTKRVHPS